MAAIPTNTIEIRSGTYMRTFDLNTSGNSFSHEQLPLGETEEDGTVKHLLSVTCPHSHLSLTKPTTVLRDCVIIQNTIVIPTSSKNESKKGRCFTSILMENMRNVGLKMGHLCTFLKEQILDVRHHTANYPSKMEMTNTKILQ